MRHRDQVQQPLRKIPGSYVSCMFGLIIGLATTLASTSAVAADPCGMVPPIYAGQGTPIARTGLQQTYVFHHRGVESFVIRPGFTGKVDNFGMLIPFPNPPAIRKVSDSVFTHIKKAIDPPEVVVFPWNRGGGFGGGGFGGGVGGGGGGVFGAPRRVDENRLQVLKKEAVGMYEVAVLSAGSAKALKKWMDENKFQYPTGMDKVTNDYVRLGWCFVAVKTKVGTKAAADPKPGQRSAKPNMPSGATFDGAVQGLGFRFRSEKLVVPMRLSAFNEGDMRNIVYLLTNGGKKIRSIPEEYVVRQISGRELISNLTDPVPLRIVGGNLNDIAKAQREKIRRDRKPEQYNEIAKALFVSDIYAADRFAQQKVLSVQHENTKKDLLAIGESLGLRGGNYDKMLDEKSLESSAELFADARRSLAKMTLTVVDGDFPRDVVAQDNLTFKSFRMARAKNSAKFYDAKLHGPSPNHQMGRLYSEADPWKNQASPNSSAEVRRAATYGLLGIVCLFVPMATLRRLRTRH